MLTIMESHRRELSGDVFHFSKEDSGRRGIPSHCFKCENIAKVTEKLKTMTCDKVPEIIRPVLYFKLSFHEKEQEQYQTNVSELTKAMKLSDYCISHSEIQHAEVNCMVIYLH